jgi:hypothetical protein
MAKQSSAGKQPKTEQPHFLDSGKARLLAVVVIVLSGTALGFIHREDLAPPVPKTTFKEAPKLNPAFVECRDTRLGQVDRMLQDKVITKPQYVAFKTRALDTCAARFPPGGSAAGPGRPAGTSPGTPPGPPPGFPDKMRAKQLPPIR